MAQIAIFHPTDPLGHVPGGIDTIVRGVLKWAPADLAYTLFGATSDEQARPVGRAIALPYGNGATFIPLVSVDSTSRRALIPLTARYMFALRRYIRNGRCAHYDALDFHRIDPAWLFRRDRRPRNIVLHQDMSILRNKNCDIMWRHAPWLYERLERGVLFGARHIFTVRRSAVERYRRLYPQIASRLSFLPTWFDSSIFRGPVNALEDGGARALLRKRLGLPEASRILVTIGRLDRQKDPLLMLQALAEVARLSPDVHLLFIGDGVLRAQVEHARTSLGLASRVHLLGVLPPAEIGQVLWGCDLFVLTSAYEGMPIAVLEALASGTPVVSTDVGEISLVIRNGLNGRITADRSSGSVAEAISTALGEIERMRGVPSMDSVIPYNPETVLRAIYENHRSQTALASGCATSAGSPDPNSD